MERIFRANGAEGNGIGEMAHSMHLQLEDEVLAGEVFALARLRNELAHDNINRDTTEGELSKAKQCAARLERFFILRSPNLKLYPENSPYDTRTPEEIESDAYIEEIVSGGPPSLKSFGETLGGCAILLNLPVFGIYSLMLWNTGDSQLVAALQIVALFIALYINLIVSWATPKEKARTTASHITWIALSLFTFLAGLYFGWKILTTVFHGIFG